MTMFQLEPMKLLYLRDLIKKHVLADQALYPKLVRVHGSGMPYRSGGNTYGEVAAAIAALDPDTCSATALDEAKGYLARETNECFQCGEDKQVLVNLGDDDPDYENTCIRICGDCLGKALAMVAAAEPRP